MKVNITQKKTNIIKELDVKTPSYNISIEIENATAFNIASLKRTFTYYIRFVNKNKKLFGFPQIEILLPKALKKSADEKLSIVQKDNIL